MIDKPTARADYVKARDLAIEADKKGLPSEHLWARARGDGGVYACDCPRKPSGRLCTTHLEGCHLKGARPSGKGGKCGPAATARKRAGYASGSALVAAAIQHARARDSRGTLFLSRPRTIAYHAGRWADEKQDKTRAVIDDKDEGVGS